MKFKFYIDKIMELMKVVSIEFNSSKYLEKENICNLKSVIAVNN